MTTDPDIQREWLLSKWERFTDEELEMLVRVLFSEDWSRRYSAQPTPVEPQRLRDEITSEIARRQADVEADA